MPVIIADPRSTDNNKYAEVLEPGADSAQASGAGAVRTSQRRRLLYDSGMVAAGAEIVSPILDVRSFSRVRVLYYNADAVTARALQVQDYAEDGVTQLPVGGWTFTADAGAANSTRWAAFTNYERNASTSLSLGSFHLFRLVAGGTANGRLIIFGE